MDARVFQITCGSGSGILVPQPPLLQTTTFSRTRLLSLPFNNSSSSLPTIIIIITGNNLFSTNLLLSIFHVCLQFLVLCRCSNKVDEKDLVGLPKEYYDDVRNNFYHHLFFFLLLETFFASRGDVIKFFIFFQFVYVYLQTRYLSVLERFDCVVSFNLVFRA